MESSEEVLKPNQRFWKLLKPDKKEIRNVYAYAIFNGLINLSLPLGIQAIVNLIQGGQMNTSWIVLVAIVVLGVAISGALQIYQLRIVENLQQKIFSRAAFEFAYRIPRIKMEELYKHYAPELMNRFFDIMSVQKGLSKILIDFTASSMQVIFGLILLSLYHPFFVAFSLILVILIAVIFKFTYKRGLQTSLKESKHKYKTAHWLEELARTETTFKLAGETDLPLNRTNKHVGDYLEYRESHFKVLVQQYSLMVVFKVIVALGLLAIGGILVMEQLMNIGQFVAAEIIILLIMSSVEKLIASLETIYDVLTSLEKVGQVTDLTLENQTGNSTSELCGQNGMELQLNDVTFFYPGKSKPNLSDINVHLEPGDRMVITGGNGAGKRSLLQLMAGLYEVQEGVVSFNGLPMGNLNLCNLRSSIGDYLSQEKLFEGSVLENIGMGRKNASFENIQWAVEAVGLKPFIQSLPNGYESHIDPQGTKLPKSTVQKMLLARSIADKPKLLLLEYPLENLREEERKDIISFLTSPEQKWSLVVISRDPFFLQSANKVVVMKDGRIVEKAS
jgi:ABC-type bacteriocin/lantibiotic exporter with double-glycine peptidase domain